MRKPNVVIEKVEFHYVEYYSIFFNSQLKWKFTNKKEAVKKVNEINKFCLEKLNNINSQLSTIYSIYRRNFFTLSVVQSQSIHSSLASIDKALELSIRLSSLPPNGASHCFGKILYSINALTDVSETLLEHSRTRNITNDMYEIKAIQTVLYLLQKSILDFEIIDVPLRKALDTKLIYLEAV